VSFSIDRQGRRDQRSPFGLERSADGANSDLVVEGGLCGSICIEHKAIRSRAIAGWRTKLSVVMTRCPTVVDSEATSINRGESSARGRFSSSVDGPSRMVRSADLLH
jgi:hypothetical protein